MTLNPLAAWHQVVQTRDPAGLDALLDEDAVFHSPVVHTPQRGRSLVRLYLGAALQLLGGGFRYVREVVGERAMPGHGRHDLGHHPVRRQLAEAKLAYDEIHTEFLGFNSLLGPLADDSKIEELNEVYLKMSVRAKDRRLAEAFPRQFPWLALSGPPTASGFSGIEPARQLLGLWPTLVRRDLVEPEVKVSLQDTAL